MATKRPRSEACGGTDPVDSVGPKLFSCIQTLQIIRNHIKADNAIVIRLMDNVIEELQNAKQLVPKKLLTARNDLSSVEYVSCVFLFHILSNIVVFFSNETYGGFFF